MKKLIILVVLLTISSSVFAGSKKTLGGMAEFTPFIVSLSSTLRINDKEGRNQLITSCFATQAVSQIQNLAFSNKKLSFDDTVFSFCGAFYTYHRYGFEGALPLFILSGGSAYQKLNKKQFLGLVGNLSVSYFITKSIVEESNGTISFNNTDYSLGSLASYDQNSIWNIRSGEAVQMQTFKTTSTNLLIAEGLNMVTKDFFPKGENYRFYFAPAARGSIGLNFKLTLD